LSGEESGTAYLLNKELSFEVDVAVCGCGMNSALRYFISMESDGGQASFGYTGVTYGTGYCDDSQPAELDIWEANSLTNVYTTHSCLNGQCDPYGGAFNTCARGAKSFYGRGTGYQPLPAGQHPAVHGCHPIRHRRRDGKRRAQRDAQRFYVQDGRTTQQQTFGGFNGLSDGFCNFYGQSNGQGSVSYGMSQGMRRGMVLFMSMWGSPNDPSSSMTWMDNEPNGPCLVYQNPNPCITFANIKIGPFPPFNIASIIADIDNISIIKYIICL
jgi:hypothetical protein